MTEQSMVRRVADAIREEASNHAVNSGPNWDSVARAAIEAMREPTRSMVDKGGFVSADTEYSKYDTVGDSRAEECWKVMISEALSAQSKGAEG